MDLTDCNINRYRIDVIKSVGKDFPEVAPAGMSTLRFLSYDMHEAYYNYYKTIVNPGECVLISVYDNDLRDYRVMDAFSKDS